MARMLDRLYAEARICVAGLRDVGLADDAAALDTALYGATSGEILTHLGFHLASIVGSRPSLPADLRNRLRALLAEIDAILKQAGQG
jgi:hypothetical protein